MNTTTGILGIRIDNLSQKEIKKKLAQFLSEKKFHWVVTLNPEIILHAYKDMAFSEILNLSDLNLVDGVGLQYINLLLGKQTIKTRYPGVDLLDFILKLAWQKKLKVLFFGGREKFSDGRSSSEITREIMQKKYPGIQILIESGGEIKQKNKKVIIDKKTINNIEKSGAEIILTALSNPIQEKFVFSLKDKVKNIRLAIGIGGSFNLISGYYQRAPKLWQNLGLEWLWRLFTKPGHWHRVLRAVIIFPSLVLFREIKPRYREGNLACIINYKNKILLAQRKRELPKITWQMPQGGREPGESDKQALLRELKEELGTDKFEIIYKCPEKHKYLIKNSYRFSSQGQKLNIWLVKFVGKDSDLKLDKRELINFRWVDKNELLDLIDKKRINTGLICLKYLKRLK